MDQNFDDLHRRILLWLADNGAPFDWRDIDGSDDPHFLAHLQHLERQNLIKAVFRISGRLGDRGRVVFAKVNGITPKGLAYIKIDPTMNPTDGEGELPSTSQTSLEALQMMQTALAEALAKPDALMLSHEAIAGIRESLLDIVSTRFPPSSGRALQERLQAVDASVLHDLIVKQVAHAVRETDATVIAALLARLAGTGIARKAG